MRTFFCGLIVVLALYSCENDSNDGVAPDNGRPDFVPEEVFNAFYNSDDFKGAANVAWKSKGEWIVAEFDLPAANTLGRAKETGRNAAWFDNGGKWYMTEKDIPFDALPSAVQTAFNNSGYAEWDIDDVDELGRKGAETVYVIEVKGVQNGVETEMDLYYSVDGVLVKELADVSDDYDYEDYILPSLVSGSIEGFIHEKYHDARIVDIERDGKGMTEVEIVDGNHVREVLFDTSDKWIYTKTEVNFKSMEHDAVKKAFESSKYSSGYRIDDIDYYETPEGNFYRFELKSVNGEVKVEIDENGNITNEYNPGGSQGNNGGQGGDNPGSNQGNGGMAGQVIEEFIKKKYPGAYIVERDYDDGLIEVEIIHENKEKDVYFNGAREWVKTRWDLRWGDVPQKVKDAIKSRYADYEWDDVEYIESPSGEYYLVELEKGDTELEVRVGPNGNIME